MTSHRFVIRKNGTLRYLEAPPFPVPGPKLRKRFSHIRPCNPVLLAAFMLLRWTFGESSKDSNVSAWTTRWRCKWRLLVISTGFTAESYNRQELLDLEAEKFFEPIGDLL